MQHLNFANIYDWPKNAKTSLIIGCAIFTLLLGYVFDSKKLLFKIQEQQLKNLALKKLIFHKRTELEKSPQLMKQTTPFHKNENIECQQKKIEFISTLAKNNKIILTNIKPKNFRELENQTPAVYIQKRRIYLQANSNFTQLLTFLKQLNQLSRSILISKLTLKSQNNFYASHSLNLDLTLELME